MQSVAIFVALAALLVAGKLLRVRLPPLQRLYLPSSVVGGLLGLALAYVFRDAIPHETVASVRAIPGFLINIIFATLLLAEKPAVRKAERGEVLPQLALAQVVAWGQYAVGTGLAGFLLAPAFGVSPAFGNLLELGFEGGHGTVGGMSAAFSAHDWEEGVALGYTVATAGMIGGIAGGMALVNWAYRRGLVKSVKPFSRRSAGERRGIHPRDARPSAGRQTVLPDSIDSLAWHLSVVGLAVLAGFLALKGLQAAEAALLPNAKTRLFDGFPMFPLCMLGGAMLRKAADAAKIDLLLDGELLKRISGAALDFLAVAAVATIQLDVVAANWLPLSIMVAAGIAWTALSVVFLSPRLFRTAWFERGIAEFGQATGVTATGLLLLRTVDPENATGAAESFAGKQLLHEPFMNLWVAVAFALVMAAGWVPVFSVSSAVLAIWLAVAFAIARRNRRIADLDVAPNRRAPSAAS